MSTNIICNWTKDPPMDSATKILNDRQKTHGDFRRHARTFDKIMGAMETSGSWHELSAVHRVALLNIAGKICRILAGDPDYDDHWDDIAGYAKLGKLK